MINSLTTDCCFFFIYFIINLYSFYKYLLNILLSSKYLIYVIFSVHTQKCALCTFSFDFCLFVDLTNYNSNSSLLFSRFLILLGMKKKRCFLSVGDNFNKCLSKFRNNSTIKALSRKHCKKFSLADLYNQKFFPKIGFRTTLFFIL